MKDYFPPHESQCKCGCGLDWTPEFRKFMNTMRHELGFPIPVSSGARCAAYDAKIGGAGVHPTGDASDNQVTGVRAFKVQQWALAHGATGIGVRQKGPYAKRIVHIDTTEGPMRPRIWSY